MKKRVPLHDLMNHKVNKTKAKEIFDKIFTPGIFKYII